MSRVIGLTGPTGAGKSMASELAIQFGFRVIDCDKVAREAVLPGTPGLSALRETFGETVLAADGTLDRKALAATAFSSPERTEFLNRVLLPHIMTLIRSRLDAPLILLDAPTLFESGADALCDDTVAVLADSEHRLARITARDGITISEARLRMSAGKSDSFYRERAGHILYNNGDAAAFLAAASALFESLSGGQKK